MRIYRSLLCFFAALATVAIAVGASAAHAQESRLAEILKRDKLIVATGNSSVPTGFIDEKGVHTGFEVEFARLLAKAILGSPDKIEFVVVDAPGRNRGGRAPRVRKDLFGGRAGAAGQVASRQGTLRSLA